MHIGSLALRVMECLSSAPRSSNKSSFFKTALHLEKLRSSNLNRGQPRWTVSKIHILLCLINKDYDQILGENEKRKQNEKASFIKRFEFMKHLTKQSIIKLSYYYQEKVFTSGNTVYKQGSLVDGFYLIRSGEFEISCKMLIDADDSRSNITMKKDKIDVRVMIYGKDDFIGLYQCLNEEHGIMYFLF